MISGTDAVISALEKKAKLVIVAKDASNATLDKISKKCYFYKVPVINTLCTEEIANATGLGNPKVIAITDQGISNQIIKIMNERGDTYES